MSVDLAKLAEIVSAQSDLDAIDTQLSTAIEAIEAVLATRISTRVEIDVTDEQFQRVGFRKVGGGRHIVVEINGSSAPLLGASRAIRARAFADGHIERLINEAANNIRSQVESRKAATEAANNILTMLAHQQGA